MINPAPALKQFNQSEILVWPGNHVFLINVDDYFEGIKGYYGSVLSNKECEKARNFFRLEDQKSYIVRKHCLRFILSILTKKEAHSIQFGHVKNKKPSIEGIPFNVSHSTGLVAIVLSNTTVGIDIEFIKEGFPYETMLSDCFSPEEQIEIAKSEQPLKYFFTLWTRKEALLKACGEGINNNLNRINLLQSSLTYNDKHYRIYSTTIFKYFAMSIAWSNQTEIIYYWTLTS